MRSCQFLAEVRLRSSRSHLHPRTRTRNVTTTFDRLEALLDPWTIVRPEPSSTRHTGLESPSFVTTAQSPITRVDLVGEGEGYEDVTSGRNDYNRRPPPHRGLSSSTATTVEITSGKSCRGKTTLLYYLSALTALPKTHGGRGSVVVYIDSDGAFSSTRLHRVMRHCLSPSTLHAREDTSVRPLDSDDESLESLAREALNHVLVFRPQSSSHLLSILDSLPTVLLDRTKHSSIHRTLGLLVVDSATSFYWQDRLDRDMARLIQSKSPGSTLDVVPETRETFSRTTRIIQRLKSLQERFECAVIFSTNSSSSSSSSKASATAQVQSNLQPPPPPNENNNTPSRSPWTNYARLTLHLEKTLVPQFAPHMSMDECLRDAEKRFEAVKDSKITATVTTNKRHHHLDRGGEEQRRRQDLGFAFKVNDGGIEF